MNQSEVKIGFEFEHGIKGNCRVINRTPKTITIKHNFGTTKVSYRYKDTIFSPSDF